MPKKPDSDEAIQNFGRRLAAVRQRRGVEVGALAERTGLDRTSFPRWEGGKSLPRLDAAVRIADALGVSLDVLLGRAPLPPLHPDVAARLSGEALPAKAGRKRSSA